MTDEELANVQVWISRALKAEKELAACKAEVVRLRDLLEHDRAGIERDELEAKLTDLRTAAEAYRKDCRNYPALDALLDEAYR